MNYNKTTKEKIYNAYLERGRKFNKLKKNFIELRNDYTILENKYKELTALLDRGAKIKVIKETKPVYYFDGRGHSCDLVTTVKYVEDNG